MPAAGRIEDDDPLPGLSIGNGSLTEGAGGGSMRFEVRVEPASGRTVTVQYGTADVTATGGSDYTAVTGTLSFGAGTTVRTVTVPIADDALHEPEEQFTVTLRAAMNATVATSQGTGTIADNDRAPELSIGDGSLTEGSDDGTMPFAVQLDLASGRTVTVQYATANVTATAGADYTSASGTLTFAAGITTATIEVAIVDDTEDEETETFTVTLSSPSGAVLAHAGATGTITDDDDTTTTDPVITGNTTPLKLASLAVTGGGAMYPAFDADTLHYALTCNDSPTLTVAAATGRAGTQLTLLRADTANNVVSTTGSLSATVSVDGDHDVAIELSDTGGTVTYVVHCLPADFPDITIVKKTDGASGGLLLVALQLRYIAVVDYNGVPRFHRRFFGRDFRHHSNGPLIDGRRVRYSVIYSRATLLDADFNMIRAVRPVAGLTHMDSHDFRIVTDRTSEDASFLFISLQENWRDYRPLVDASGNPYSSRERVQDTVIQEVSLDGRELFQWHSWEKLMFHDDCRRNNFVADYAHINSFQVIGGDIVASFSGCNQVVRIDRMTDDGQPGTGELVWKVGGTAAAPTLNPNQDTEFLEIVDDTAGEFCGQHHATLSDDGRLLLFDNGSGCLGPRKAAAPYSRVVEYDISSGTQARFTRAYIPPNGYYTGGEGAVTRLPNGNWLIAWGNPVNELARRAVSISEVDPDTGDVHFEMRMIHNGHYVNSYRAYRYPEDEVPIPLNLP